MKTDTGARLNDLAGQAQSTWHRFSELFEPVRPELYRYCRALTRNAWDAEDLVQDALARALVTLGCLFQKIDNPRAWLFRVASNLWIDRQRQRRAYSVDGAAESEAPRQHVGVETREAGASLIGRLSPQERAALLLKDVFDFTSEEIAEMLTTTPGAVKTALHRGRGKLAEPEPAERRPVDRGVLEAFCEAFNARDMDRLIALLLNTGTAEIAGIATEYTPEKMKQTDTGSLHHSLFSPISHAVQPAFCAGDRGGTPRVELRDYHGEPVIVAWYDNDDGPVVRDVIRVDTEGDRISRIRYHFFSPDVIEEVSKELALPGRSNGYRYWAAEV